MRSPSGFTLLELLLSLAIIAIILAIAAPFYLSYQTRNDFHIALETAVQTLRRAQALAEAGSGDSPWGVHVGTGELTLFQGADFSSRNVDFDEPFSFPTNITLGGLSEVTFSKTFGLPSSAGSFTFESVTHETDSVTVNAKGMIDY